MERVPVGAYSQPVHTTRIKSVLKDAYAQLPDDGRATVVELVGRGEMLRIPYGIMHGDIFQSLSGVMQFTFRVMTYDPDSVKLAPSFREMFVQDTKHRRLGLVAGMVVSGLDIPSVRSYAIQNPFAHDTCRLDPGDLESVEQFVISLGGSWQHCSWDWSKRSVGANEL